MVFPDGFIWGTAASSTQAEGAAPGSDWAAWEDAGRAPRSADGNGFASQYTDDFRLYAELGLTHHRLSLPWARIEPRAGQVDHGEVERYREMLTSARNAGVTVWACLHHFTVPGWFVDEGGFADAKAAGYFWPRWADRCGQLFGDLVHGWKPINEPVAYASTGWLGGEFPPGRRDVDAYFTVLRNIHVAWRDASRQLRGAGQPIATIANLSPVFAIDASSQARAMAQLVDDVIFGITVRALRDGVLAIPGRAEEPLPDLEGSADLLGFSYYNAIGVDAGGAFSPYPPGAKVGPLGYAYWPEGLTRVLERLATELPGIPLLVAELGIGTTDDGLRTTLLHESMQRVEAAIDDGIDVRGMFFWTGVDNYEWNHAWTVPFGIIDRDRVPKGSAELVATTIREGRVPEDSP